MSCPTPTEMSAAYRAQCTHKRVRGRVIRLKDGVEEFNGVCMAMQGGKLHTCAGINKAKQYVRKYVQPGKLYIERD